jgi:deoxycytidine triphosphate deaminase
MYNKDNKTNVLHGNTPKERLKMPILSDVDLEKAIQSGEVQITPKPHSFEPATIDLSVGEEAFAASKDEITPLSKGQLLIIPPGEMVLIVTKEEIKLGPQIAGHIGLRSSFTRKGLVLLAGPQIDPGFEGTLHVVLCNLSPTEIAIAYGESFCTIELHRLEHAAETPYKGASQKQKGITPNEIDDIRERRGYALSEVIKDMQSIAKDVSVLKNSVEKLTNRTDKYMAIFVSTLAVFVIGVLVKLFAF